MFVTGAKEHTLQKSSVGCEKVTEHMHTVTHTELQVKEAQTTEERLKEPQLPTGARLQAAKRL